MLNIQIKILLNSLVTIMQCSQMKPRMLATGKIDMTRSICYINDQCLRFIVGAMFCMVQQPNISRYPLGLSF